MDKKELRAIFEKTDRAIFISHLDLMRTMQRAIKRSRIPVWYTEGFNPRIYLMFPLALSLGVESKVEIMDFYITEDVDAETIKAMLNNAMPNGLKIVNIYTPVNNIKDIGYSEYFVKINMLQTKKNIETKYNDFINMDTINIEKRSKKGGTRNIDIKQYIQFCNVTINDNEMSFNVTLPSGVEFNLNSSVVIEAMEKAFGVEFDQISIERTKILTNSSELFI